MRIFRQTPPWLLGLLFCIAGIFLIKFAAITEYSTLSGLLMFAGIACGLLLLTKL